MDQFNLTARSLLEWTRQHAEPSSPHQEHVPFVELFRPLAVTNWTWVDLWGEDYRL